MRTIEIQAYKLNELDEQTKQKVIEDNIYINVEFDWWDCTYDTLRECGIKVNSFDIGTADRDGKVSRQEFLDATPMMLEMADRNADGVISKDDFGPKK